MFEWVCNLTVFSGAALLAFKRPIIGYILLTLGSAFFIVFGIITEQYSFTFVNVFFCIINLIGLKNWTTPDKETT